MNKQTKVLFYYPSNKKSVQIETELIELKKRGIDIYFLTTCEQGVLHENLAKEGIKTYSNFRGKKFFIYYYFIQIIELIKFCNRNQIDVVWSNLQHANFIAVIAQYFMSSKVICFRHHFKFNKELGINLEENKMEVFFDKVINLLAKKIIVPSSGVFEGMKKYEKVDMKKVEIIPYIYDFSKYGKPNNENVSNILKKYPAKLHLIMCARLIPFKRHILVFPIIKKLKEEGLDIRMFVLDDGHERKNLEQYVEKNDLSNHIIMLGFKQDFLDYMAASDVLIHPSLTEASNNVAKEIGLMKKIIIVCKGVGDFDEYVIDGVNGFLVQRKDPSDEIEKIIRKIYNDKEYYKSLGSCLHDTIISKFNLSENVINQYIKLSKV